MIRRIAVTLALVLLPAAAMAQQPKHPATASTAAHMDHQAMLKQHEDFLQSILAKRGELKLTDAQVKQLKEFDEDMAEQHEKMMKAEAKAAKHELQEDSMHQQLMAIFTPAQRQQVEAMMKEHMKSLKDCKDANGKAQCSMDMGKMKH